MQLLSPTCPRREPISPSSISSIPCSVLPNTSDLDHKLELQTLFAWLIPPHLHTFLGFRKDSLGIVGNGGKVQQPSCKALPRAAPAPCPGVQHCHSTLARWHSLPVPARLLQLRGSLWQAVRVKAILPCLQLLERDLVMQVLFSFLP